VIVVENRKIFSPRVFKPLMKGPPWNWVPALGVKKLDDWDTGPKKEV